MAKLSQLTAIAMAVIIGGVALGIGTQLFWDTGVKFDPLKCTNDSITFTCSTCGALSHVPISSIITISNATDIFTGSMASSTRQVANVAWYMTCNNATVANTNALNITFNSTYDAGTWNVTYMHYDTKGLAALRNSSLGTIELSSWMPTIGMVLAISILIGLIYSAFKRGGI